MSKASSKKSQFVANDLAVSVQAEDDEAIYRFGPFRLETTERILRNGEVPVAITPKAFDILHLLVRNHGRLVTKQRLLETIWPDTFVEESTLAQNIFTLRKALGPLDDGRQYIETVPKHGYRFVGEVEVGWPPAAHQPVSVPRSHDIDAAPAGGRGEAPRLLLIVGAVAAAVLLLTVWFVSRHTLAQTAFRRIEIERLTNGASVAALAISPDGKYVAYASDRGDGQSLVVRQVATTSSTEIRPPSPVGYRGITFSRDGAWIYYVTVPHDSYFGTLFRVPLLGGAPQRVLRESVGSRIDISPDGKRLAYVHWIDPLHTSLKIVNVDGGGERQLATLDYADGFSVDGPSWSPDGKTILAATWSYNGSRPFARVLAIDVRDGSQRTFVGGRWNWIGQMSWLADGSGIILTAWSRDSEVMSDQVWLLSYPSGDARPLSNDINGFLGVGVSSDAKVIAASMSIASRNFWVAPKGDWTRASRITNGSGELYSERLGAAWMPDGAVVFGSRQAGSPDIWTMDGDGSHPKQLTAGDAVDKEPAVSPDGKTIAFVSNRGGSRDQLWRMNADGSEVRRLAVIEGVASPAFSPDGKWIVFEAGAGGKSQLWHVATEGGAPAQVTRDPAHLPAVSPDGKFIACLTPNDAPGPARLTVLSFDGGRVAKQFDAPVPRGTPSLKWSPDGSAVTYVSTRNGVSNIWSQPLDGGEPKPLTDWKSDVIYRFDWSRDGSLLCERGSTVSDVILLRDGAR